jgi:hypothetical protein
MKTILFICLVVIPFFGMTQNDTLTFTNKIEAANHIYGLLDDSYYDYALLNRSATTNPIIFEQLNNDYSHIMSPFDFLNMYSDLTISYSDTTLIPTVSGYGTSILDFFNYQDAHHSELVQPFGLTLNNISYIDTNIFNNQSFNTQNGQLTAVIDDTLLYKKSIIKSASVIEFYPDNGYLEGTLKYDPNFIVTSADITINTIQININDGNGYQLFDADHSSITYSRMIDSTVANVLVNYTLNDLIYEDRMSFYLTTKSNNTTNRSSNDLWDNVYLFDQLNNSDLQLEYGIRYGCGNNGKIRRPIIISPPYRPGVQMVSMNKYWTQFNEGGNYSGLIELGYDIIFIKDHPGYASLELGGFKLSRFISYINEKKGLNYPDEDWETIVMGYSKGGQVARYALLLLEKDHMENGGPHHHTRLYIPFDSPHHGVNVPLFTQATYKSFKLTNIIALIANTSLVDPASRDMGYYSIYDSDPLPNSTPINQRLIPKPNQAAIDYQTQLNTLFQHTYTHTGIGDTRKTFPTFSRNIAISTGSYKNDYNMQWQLNPGKLLFSQTALGYNLLTGTFGSVNRKLFASEYSSTSAKQVFKRLDIYQTPIPYVISKNYYFKNALEFDMAQGGSKTLFFDGVAGGATAIMQTGAGGTGTKHYNNEVMFLPLVSALGIKPSIWENDNLYYNLQDEDMFYQSQYNLDNNILSEHFGYPSLGHPLGQTVDHFDITPFEAVYADLYSWDHIKMLGTIEDYTNSPTINVTINDLWHVGNFIVKEVEDKNVYLQNKIIGQNHKLDPNYEYKAWYKARQSISFGRHITPKTDEGDYIIESTGNITAYAPIIHLMPGFHSKLGSTFHGYNDVEFCQSNTTHSQSNSTDNANAPTKTFKTETNLDANMPKDNTPSIAIFPNPNNGNFTFKTNSTNLNGMLYIYGLDGKIHYQLNITTPITRLALNLDKGLYIATYNTEVLKITLH